MNSQYKMSDFYVEIYFGEFPSESMRDGLKVCGWKWNPNKKCWFNKKTNENIVMAKNVCEQMNPHSDPLKVLPTKIIELNDIVIRCNSFYCNEHHQVKDVAGVISLINKKGDFIEKKVALAYCENCNKYYMLEGTYKELKKWGVIGCKIRKKENIQNEKLEADGWREESLLKILGYSVSKQDDLSSEQRKSILVNILNKGLMTKDRILSYLDFFVGLSTNDESISCWKEDRKYIEQYNIDKQEKVQIFDIWI